MEGTKLPGVFTVRTPQDAIGCRKYAEEQNCKRAVVVGGGFIGLEVAENLMAKGLSVTVMDMAAQLMPNIFDTEMADYVRRKLQAKGMRILTGTALQRIAGTDRVTGVQTGTGTDVGGGAHGRPLGASSDAVLHQSAVARGVDVRQIGALVFVRDDAAPVHLQAGICQEFRGRADACRQDDHLRGQGSRAGCLRI